MVITPLPSETMKDIYMKWNSVLSKIAIGYIAAMSIIVPGLLLAIHFGWIPLVAGNAKLNSVKTASVWFSGGDESRALLEDASQHNGDSIAVLSLKDGRFVFGDKDGELTVISRSKLTGGGAIAVFDVNTSQSFLVSDGVLALRGDEEIIRRAMSATQNYGLIIGASPDSSTLTMRDKSSVKISIEAGKTENDPLDILGGRITLNNNQQTFYIDATGSRNVQTAP